MKKIHFTALMVTGLSVISDLALAHEGEHYLMGFSNGFIHPFGGIDHWLVLLGLGFVLSRFKWAINFSVALVASLLLLNNFSDLPAQLDYLLGFFCATFLINGLGFIAGFQFRKIEWAAVWSALSGGYLLLKA